jgi:hypothetical protein
MTGSGCGQWNVNLICFLGCGGGGGGAVKVLLEYFETPSMFIISVKNESFYTTVLNANPYQP